MSDPPISNSARPVTESRPRATASKRAVALLLLGSGLSALVYQTAWQQMLRLVFGASTAASAAVLAIFLGGLGAGGLFLGRRAERYERPLFLYGNLELGVSLIAAISPWTIEAVRLVYLGAGGSEALGASGAAVLRLGLTTLAIGPAVVLMGGTLPAAARAVETAEDTGRKRVATLYAANTAGAVVGALLGTFVLFEVFGAKLTLWIACLLNLLVAVIARALGREQRVPVREEATPAPEEREPAPAPRALVYVAAATVGFAFLSLELIWYRLLAPLLGGSTFTFGLILAVALAGIGIGGFVYSRRDVTRSVGPGLLATTLAVEAFFVGLPIALGDRIAIFTALTRPLAAMGFGALVGQWTVVAAIVVLPAAVISGYQFPILFALLGRGREGVARHVGEAYALNTIGAIAGSLTCGFVLIPQIGAVTTWRLMVALLAAMAVAALGVSLWRERWAASRHAVSTLSMSGIACLTLFAAGPTAAWRHEPIGAGRVNLRPTRNAVREWRLDANANLLEEHDGLESAVAISAGANLGFLVNGKMDGAVSTDRGTQIMLGVLAALRHPNPRSAFVIGLGTGMTSGWLGRLPGMERVDTAELEPAVLEVARYAAAANHDVLDLSHVHVTLGDGREILATRSARYDLVVSEPSNPYRAGIASLFTREFYELAEERLAEGGYFAQWLQGYEIDTESVRVVLKTVRSVFPYVEIWMTSVSDLLVLASRTPFSIDVGDIRRRIEHPIVQTALLRGWLVSDVEGVLAHYVAPNALVTELIEPPDIPINSDDTNVLEYAFGRSVGKGGQDLALELLLKSSARKMHRPDVNENVDFARVDLERPRLWNILGQRAPERLPFDEPATRRHAKAIEAACLGNMNVRDESLEEVEPMDAIEQFARAQARANRGDESALEDATALEKRGAAVEAQAIRTRFTLARRDKKAALAAAIRGVEALRRQPLPFCIADLQILTALKTVALGDPDLARQGAEALLGGPLSAYMSNRFRIQIAQELAHESGDAGLCVRSMARQLEYPWWTESFLEKRAACLTKAKHPRAEEALQDLADFRRHRIGGF